MHETRDDTPINVPKGQAARMGVVCLFSGNARFACEPLAENGRVGIGRDDPLGALLTDEKLSRHHATIAMRGEHFVVTDLGSRNGTFVDGVRVLGEVVARAGAIVRAAGTIVMLSNDFTAMRAGTFAIDGGIVRGPRFTAVLEAAVRARAPLGISGETGTGKELVARAFAGDGPFVAVNCATIPEGVAERVLFGAKRGAFSGASRDADGLLQAADGGVVFLDEALELSPAVQAKLVRVMETGEVLALGATTPTNANVRFCLASHEPLRDASQSGGFRKDLLFRVKTHVVVPPLRDRVEEIPHLVAWELSRASLTAHARLIEACMLRAWPGNVRELLYEITNAGDTAKRAGVAVVRPEHLSATAGIPTTNDSLTKERIIETLARTSGNISEASRLLGLHRTQLKRAMEKHGITAKGE